MGTIKKQAYRLQKKRIIAVLICITMALLPSGCKNGTTEKEQPTETNQITAEPTEKPALAVPEAEDQALLDQIRDDIHTVADADFAATTKDMKEQTGKYSGQIYQLEGVYVETDGVPMLKNGDAHIVLKYVTETLSEGEYIRVTGVVNAGEESDTEDAVLEIITIEHAAES